MNLEQRLSRGLPLGPPGGRTTTYGTSGTGSGDAFSDGNGDGALADGACERVAAADAAQRAAADASLSDPMSRPPPGWGGGGKGAKAARADAQWDALQRAKAVDVDALRALDAVRGTVSGGRGEMQSSAAASAAAAAADRNNASDDDDSDDDADDDDFLARYRASRLAQLRSAAAAGSAHPHAPRYGELRELAAADELPPAVDGVPLPAAAVVLLWEPYLPPARALRAALSALAPLHPGTAFFAIRASGASASFDPIALPTLVVYRGGAVAATLLRAHEQLSVGDGWGSLEQSAERRAHADPLAAAAARGSRGRMTAGTSAILLATAGPAAIDIDAAVVEALLVREGVLTAPVGR